MPIADLAELAWRTHAEGRCPWATSCETVCGGLADPRMPRNLCTAHGTEHRSRMGAALVRLAEGGRP